MNDPNMGCSVNMKKFENTLLKTAREKMEVAMHTYTPNLQHSILGQACATQEYNETHMVFCTTNVFYKLTILTI